MTLCALAPHRIQQLFNSVTETCILSTIIILYTFLFCSSQSGLPGLWSEKIVLSCPILAFKKRFSSICYFPSWIYILPGILRRGVFTHPQHSPPQRGFFPFTNYLGIVASILYYIAEKQMVMWGRVTGGGLASVVPGRIWIRNIAALSPLATVVTSTDIHSECVCVKTEDDTRNTFLQCVFLQLKLYISPCCNFMFLYAQFFIFMTTLAAGQDKITLVWFPSRYWVSDARNKAVICAEAFLYIYPVRSHLWCCNTVFKCGRWLVSSPACTSNTTSSTTRYESLVINL